MKCIDHQTLTRMGVDLLTAAGASPSEATVVAEELVETSLMGLDSHGIIRLAQYLRQIDQGGIQPGCEPTIIRQTPTTLVVDGNQGFGMVTARFMTDQVAALARTQHLAAAVSQRTHHVGRLGSYVQRLAQAGFVSLAFANASRQGHYVTPWGGAKGRLGTNPLAWGCPTAGDPVVFDMSTSMVAEGTIRAAWQRGGALPADCTLDEQGRPTTDPSDFYDPKLGTGRIRGAILPFGGRQGYKGFGLSLLVELLGATLAGVPVTPEDQADPYINGFFILAINPDGFCGRNAFSPLVDELLDYIRSSSPAPDSDGVVLPGQRDWATRQQRLQAGVPISDGTWQDLAEAARLVKVEIDRYVA